MAGQPATSAVTGPGQSSREVRYAQVRRVTLVGAGLDFALALAKLVGGWLGHSQALIADGIHSLSDLVTDALVLLAAKHAHAEADEEHPYGHARIETVATVGLGVVLVMVGLGVVVDAVRRLLDPSSLVVPAAWALAIAAVSVVSKEGMYHYTMAYARRLRSNLLRANAWHTRSDAISSVVVIVGVGGALVGMPYLDAVAAVVVAWMIARIGVDLVRRSVLELIDTGLDPDQIERLRGIIMAVDGVGDLHQLRTRQMGGHALVDVHIILRDPRVSVSEGHQISETVRAVLIREMDEVVDVMVHIDPEDDELAAPGRHLELRGPVLSRLERAWAGCEAADRVKRVNLHYLDGQIHVEVELPAQGLRDSAHAQALREDYRRALAGDPDVAGVRVLFS